MADDREELRAALEARRELGPEREADVADAFLARIERQIDARVEARLAEKQPPDSGRAFRLAVISLALGIPLSAIASGNEGLAGLAIAWLGIVLVNLAARRF